MISQKPFLKAFLPCLGIKQVQPESFNIEEAFLKAYVDSLPCEIQFYVFIGIDNLHKGSYKMVIEVVPPGSESGLKYIAEFGNDSNEPGSFYTPLLVKAHIRQAGKILFDVILNEEQLSILTVPVVVRGDSTKT